MKKKLGVVMDPIAEIHYKKDSTLAMLWEAQAREWELFYIDPAKMFLQTDGAFAITQSLNVFHDETKWYTLGEELELPLAELDVILMRKDPPFNLDYIYLTYLLEHAERAGVLVINKPQSLRDANEKLYTTWFPQCMPPTLITKSIPLLRQFYAKHQDIVCKPLDAMGGSSVFRVMVGDQNASVIFETITNNGTQFMAVQTYLPDIKMGDKRILLIDGEPVEYALARMPAVGELRGNLAAGGTGVAQPLTDRDRWICQQVGPALREKGLYFVGLDVIGDYLTEINVTSPTCIRELDAQCGLTISQRLFDMIDRYLD